MLEFWQPFKRALIVLGFAVTEQHKKQCYVFKQGAVLRNDFGTAPGLYYEAGRRCLVMLPGPPRELKPMFEQQVLARLVASQRLSQQTFFAVADLRVWGV